MRIFLTYTYFALMIGAFGLIFWAMARKDKKTKKHPDPVLPIPEPSSHEEPQPEVEVEVFHHTSPEEIRLERTEVLLLRQLLEQSKKESDETQRILRDIRELLKPRLTAVKLNFEEPTDASRPVEH